ncbi:packaged DNA stabilization gp4 family protein [Yersinia rochesterensis]|uniref:packaged DNA stabilization gp4 family protein n=1 Tax=Yersinia rochesterensis TaxID=1604335 RepID=UPI0028530E89|nr:packaged DNA stabilization gp4 family protein [Yersinia rochesterensis]MDR5020037.1 packaged DNA stabilization gp4 family protein [Yersinia rochesterensis]
MARTKGDLALKALRKVGLFSDATLTDAEPQAISDSLYDLEDMMARWAIEGIDLGYIFSENPLTGDDSGIPAWANDGVSLKLALQMCLDNVIPASDQLLAEADNAYQTICTALTTVPPLQRRNDMPTGQGNGSSFTWNRFYIERDTLNT